MALLVFFSTMSFTVDQHFCGDTMVDYSFFGDAETCGMDQQKESSNSSDCGIIKKNCCSDEIVSFEGQDELKITFQDLSLDQQLFIVSFIYSYIDLFEGLEQNIVPFEHYPPPNLVRDILILDQTFLI